MINIIDTRSLNPVTVSSLTPGRRASNRLGWVGLKPNPVFSVKILTVQSALKIGSVGPNSLLKVKKNSNGLGRAILGRAKFDPIFSGQ